MEKKFVFIGKLVKLAKINLTTLKYYSKIGLLPYLQFAKNKNRVYDLEKSRKRLAEIKKLKAVGYTLEMMKREFEKKVRAKKLS
ncbi:MAG: MerR family transcriptional regulator [bacterium]